MIALWFKVLDLGGWWEVVWCKGDLEDEGNESRMNQEWFLDDSLGLNTGDERLWHGLRWGHSGDAGLKEVKGYQSKKCPIDMMVEVLKIKSTLWEL